MQAKILRLFPRKSGRLSEKYKITAKQISTSTKYKWKEHRALKFESSNIKVAKVTSKGVLKGVKKGSATIYAYAQNGVFAKVIVTVK